MWLLAIPVLLILLLLLFVGGLITAIVGVVKVAPWLLILLGVWLLLRDRRSDRRRHPAWAGSGGHQHGWPRDWHQGERDERGERSGPPTQRLHWSAAPAQPDAQTPHGSPRPTATSAAPTGGQTARLAHRELPIDVQVKVEQITRKADMLLGYADRFPPFSRDLYLVRQTTADYLPRTTAAYLALPGTDDPVVSASGKTAVTELREQLELLDSKLDDIAQDLQRQDLDRMLANRQFLEARFRLLERDSLLEDDGQPKRRDGTARDDGLKLDGAPAGDDGLRPLDGSAA